MNAPFDKTPTNLRASQANIASAASRPTAAPAAAAATQPQGGAPDVGAMVRRVFAHWQVVIVTLLIGGIVTFQIVKSRVPQFKSETVIFYREGIGKSVTGPTEGPDALRTLGTKLKETLLAQQTLRRIIDEFHLYPDAVQKGGYAEAVDMMRKKTDFKSRSQDTFAISFEGTTRDEAQKVCARMAEILVVENAKRLAEEHRSTTEFLEVEKKRADEELERAEREVSEFLNLHPEFANSKDLGTSLIAEKKKLAAEDARLKRPATGGGKRRGAAAPAPAPPAPGLPAAPAAAAVDPVLIAARNAAQAELTSARKDLNEKSGKYTEQHPDVRAARARFANAEAALKQAEEAVAAAQPAEPAPAPRKVAAVEDPYGGSADGAASAMPSVAAGTATAPSPKRQVFAEPGEKLVNIEVEWSRMSRALSQARGRLTDLDGKLYRAEMVASTNESGYGNKIAVLDPAYKPGGPSNAPNKTVVMIGLGASIAVGLVLSAAWGLFLDDRVFSAGEIEIIVMVPVIGVVPKEKEPKKKKKGGDEKDKAKEAIAKAAKARADARAAATRGTTSG